MAKKIFLAIFGGLAAAGLAVMLVGFSMGGRPGSVRLQNGSVVYVAAGEEVRLGNAPTALHGRNEAGEYSDASEFKGWHETDAAALQNYFSGAKDIPLPEDGFAEVEIDITAGYVTVIAGDEARLQVLGPLETTAKMDEGVCEIKSESDLNSFYNVGSQNGMTRFYQNGNDVTTEYLITLPAGVRKVDVGLSIGAMTVQGLSVEEGEFSQDVGSLLVNDCTVQKAEVATNLGAAEVRGFSGASCALKVDVGSIDFKGQVSDVLKVDCDLGGVTATLPRPESYGWRAEVGLGSITIDGVEHGHMFRDGAAESNANARPLLDLECGMGSIDVKFA